MENCISQTILRNTCLNLLFISEISASFLFPALWFEKAGQFTAGRHSTCPQFTRCRWYESHKTVTFLNNPVSCLQCGITFHRLILHSMEQYETTFILWPVRFCSSSYGKEAIKKKKYWHTLLQWWFFSPNKPLIRASQGEKEIRYWRAGYKLQMLCSRRANQTSVSQTLR